VQRGRGDHVPAVWFHVHPGQAGQRGGQRAAGVAVVQVPAAAERLGADRNDYDTEFGPSNVAIHAVSVAVELGDVGQALDLAQAVEADSLSPERRSRYLIYLATAHTMRRQVGEALHDLQEAERIAPELTRAHGTAREVTRDLLQLSGLRPRPELRELAERFGVLP
jgi:hypothetical protein